MSTLRFPSWLLAAGLASFCLTAAAQDRPDPEQLRSQAQSLIDKARDLKGDGQIDESEQAARKAKELLRQADDLQQKRRDQPRDRAADVERSRRSDRPDDGASSRDRRAPDERTERRRPAERRLRDGGGSGPSDRVPPDFRRGEPRDGERILRPRGPLAGELALKRYHIKRAIKHLRAAGLSEQADRLEDRLHAAERRFREFRRERAREFFAPDRPAPRRELTRPQDREREDRDR